MRYPIYIPSKGRAASQKTVRLLESCGILNFYVIVENDEYDEYKKWIPKNNLLKLPLSDYGTSTVARNFAIVHSTELGFSKHWQLDDDINKVVRHEKGKTIHIDLVTIMTDIENLSAPLESVYVSGIPTLGSFLSQQKNKYNINTSLTSFYLIRNSPFRFRGTMLVDMDYQLQVLQAGYSTIKFNDYAFNFITPMKQPGGYCDIYANEKKRIDAIQKFLQYHPMIDGELKKLPNGIWVLKNIRFVWANYKDNNKKEILKQLPQI
jgi:hypothetical protein